MTKSPFRKSSPKATYLKIGVFGDTGTGKTLLALSAPKVAIVDAEGGTTAYERDYKFEVVNSQSYKDLEGAIVFLESGKHDFKTIAYDPATVLYEAIQEARTRFRGKGKAEGDAGNLDFSDWGHIKRIYKQLMVRFVNLPMNVILTFREKDKWDHKDPNNPKYLGKSFDGEKSTPYYMDIWGRMVTLDDGKRVLKVMKSRYKGLQGEKILIPEDGGFDKIYSLCVGGSKKATAPRPKTKTEPTAKEETAEIIAAGEKAIAEDKSDKNMIDGNFGDGTTTDPADIPDAAEQEQIRQAEIKESEGK